jgi:hypothetical protein
MARVTCFVFASPAPQSSPHCPRMYVRQAAIDQAQAFRAPGTTVLSLLYNTILSLYTYSIPSTNWSEPIYNTNQINRLGPRDHVSRTRISKPAFADCEFL